MVLLAAVIAACAQDTKAPEPLASRQHSHKQPYVVSVNVRPRANQKIAGDSTKLCAFVVMSDGSIEIGIGDSTTSAQTISYCSGAPLKAFLSERST